MMSFAQWGNALYSGEKSYAVVPNRKKFVGLAAAVLVIGFLTILGYSLYDTVVVFDKVRELTADVYDQKHFTFAEYVNLAVNQTMVRSINTSVVALLPVGAILIIGSVALGPGTLVDISLALFIGMIAGTYSSIFIASPLLVTFQEMSNKTREHDAAVCLLYTSPSPRD